MIGLKFCMSTTNCSAIYFLITQLTHAKYVNTNLRSMYEWYVTKCTKCINIMTLFNFTLYNNIKQGIIEACLYAHQYYLYRIPTYYCLLNITQMSLPCLLYLFSIVQQLEYRLQIFNLVKFEY